MGFYRKFLEIEMGEVDEGVRIGAPQRMDMDRPGEWRRRVNEESMTEAVRMMRECGRLDDLMRVQTSERRIGQEGDEIPVKVYFTDVKGKAPVMLFCHGGSFSMNSVEVYDMVHRYFACYGKMTVVAVDYRLAPEHEFPCGLEDCYTALLWAEEHVEELGGSRENINICGDSSGGNFAAALCLMARDRKGPRIRRQALIYPVTSLAGDKPTESEVRYGKGYFLEYEDIRKLHAVYVPEGTELTAPYLSPLYAVDLTGLPPAGFFSAECDPLLDQGLMYAARLADAGVKTEYHIYKGMIHAFLNAAYPKTFEMMDEVCRFLK
ncbi:MAG: alpha/beta hydrolase [Dorea sp.]|nr:alpha/beta hydrolase [Dorea sp.]